MIYGGHKIPELDGFGIEFDTFLAADAKNSSPVRSARQQEHRRTIALSPKFLHKFHPVHSFQPIVANDE